MAKINIPKLTLSTVLEYTTLYTAAILFFEGFKIYYYYNLFGFDISEYLSISFLFNSFLGSVSKFTLVVLGFILIGLINIVGGVSSGLDAIDRENIDNLNPKTGSKKWLTYYSFNEISSMIFSGIFIYKTIRFYIRYPKFSFISTIGLIFFICLLLAMVFNRFLIPRFRRYRNTVTLVIFIYCLFGLFVFAAYYQYDALTKSEKNRNTAIEYTDGTILPAHGKEFYIGRTPEYIFLHNETEQVTRIVNASDVKRINNYAPQK